MKKLLFTLLVISLALSGCASQETSETLIGDWKLTSYSSIEAVPDTEAGLTFNEDGTLTGHTGCNGLGGTYTVEGDQITFSDITSTLIACEEPLMTQEGIVHQVLTGTATFQIEGITLRLTNDGTVLTLTR